MTPDEARRVDEMDRRYREQIKNQKEAIERLQAKLDNLQCGTCGSVYLVEILP